MCAVSFEVVSSMIILMVDVDLTEGYIIIFYHDSIGIQNNRTQNTIQVNDIYVFCVICFRKFRD